MTLQRVFVWGILGVVLFSLSACRNPPSQAPKPVPLHWTMINVNAGEGSAESHLLRFPHGEVYLLDAGGTPELMPWLKQQGFRSLDKVIITHAHKNHYEALTAMIEEGIQIKALYFNLPLMEVCNRERPWGCDYPHVMSTIERVRATGTPLYSVKAGDVFYEKEGLKLEVLYVYDGQNTPVGQTDVNDTSLIMKLQYGQIKVMLTGDLNQGIGGYLAEHGQNLEATILKVPHHGAEGAAPDLFFDRVGAKVALVPGPKKLWLSERSRRLKNYFEAHAIDLFVNGLHGHVLVELYADHYQISTQKAYQP